MSSFTPRAWKSHAERSDEAPIGKFQSRRFDKPNNLPIAPNAFIGRERDVTSVKELLSRHRLLTLVGSGGVGKTRLALQVGTELLDRYPDGVWFVDLARLSDPALVPSALAEIFDVRDSGSRSMIDGVIAASKHKKLMLILDNCEHVIAAAADVADRILKECPDVRMIATSREPLVVPGEELFRMPALAVPPEGQTLDASRLMEYAAIALFVARAQAVKREFALDDANASIVADIVRRLDGIALAIELAAARIKVLGVKQLSEKLDERFKLLTGGSRTVLPRQQTLRALFDWSYGLLSDDEQRMFRKTAIFAGGFTLDLAVAVCAGDIEEFDVIDLLQSLVDKSLLQSEEIGAEARYRYLESTRAFAHEKLLESGDHGEAAKAHAAALTELAERLGGEWRANRASENVSDSRRELDNWRAALRWALREKGDVELGQQLVAALRFAWAQFALAEGRSWIAEATAAATPPPPKTLARLRLADAHVATLFTNYKVAHAAAKEALELLDPENDRRLVAEAQMLSGAALGILGSFDEGESLLRQALETFSLLGARNDVGTALQSLGIIRAAGGDVAASREFYARALVAYRDANADVQAAYLALNLAEVEFQAGNAIKALDLANEALASDSLRLDETETAYGLCNVAAYELSMDRILEATAHAREALALSRANGSEISLALALQHLATAVALHSSNRVPENSARNAAAILGFVDRSFDDLGYTREHTELQEYERALAVLGASIGEELRASMISEGRSWTVDKVVKVTEDVTRGLQGD